MNIKIKGIIVVSICIFFIVLMGYTTFKITDKSLREFNTKCEKEYGKDNYIIYSCNGGFGSYCCQPKPINPLEHLPINTLTITGTLNTNNTFTIQNTTYGVKE